MAPLRKRLKKSIFEPPSVLHLFVVSISFELQFKGKRLKDPHISPENRFPEKHVMTTMRGTTSKTVAHPDTQAQITADTSNTSRNEA